MHIELQRFFDEHDTPSHACKDDVHAALRPVSTLGADARKQLVEYEAMLDDAMHAPHDAKLDGKVEHMRQTLAAAHREVGNLCAAAREVNTVFAQLDRYMAEWKTDIANIEAHAAQSDAAKD